MITQYNFDLVALNIATLEDSARAHAQVAIDATNKLLLLDGDTPQSSIQDLIQAIEARQHNLKQRAEELLNHQLQTFFEQAPTEVDGADDSVPVEATIRFFKKSIDAIVTGQITAISGPVRGCLADHGWLPWEQKDKEAFPSLKGRLYQLQSRQLPRHLAIRARRERALVKSIQTLLRKRPDIVLRRPDKRKGFYLGNAADFERKAMKYTTDRLVHVTRHFRH
ncbi:unnamed protein product [Didymodactylos carnosus]|uniref:Uncharacterized protein n=1 Tax=Didymodactylos carnosus TaxID=1234261 RepID=A0A8S2FAN0_9BILA|nr:unnamed protein product [Didymodactylos carnosus]CAF4209893.1 unnamed protein product [Didymodactylos carnosus]